MNHEEREDGEVTQMFSSRHAQEAQGQAESEEALWNVCYSPKDQRQMTTDQVILALSRREISAYTLVWREGMQNWVQIGNVPLLVQARRQNNNSFRPQRPFPTPSAPPAAVESRVTRSELSQTSSSIHGWALDPNPRPKSLAQAAPPKPALVSMADEAWNEEEEPTRQMQVHDPLPSMLHDAPTKQRTLMGLGDSSPPPSNHSSAVSLSPRPRSMVPPPPRAARVGGSSARVPRPSPPSVAPSARASVPSEPAPSSVEAKPQAEPKRELDASPTNVNDDRELLLEKLKRWKLAALILGGVSVALVLTTLTLLLSAPKSPSSVPVQASSEAR
jgi:hypothetical protein